MNFSYSNSKSLTKLPESTIKEYYYNIEESPSQNITYNEDLFSSNNQKSYNNSTNLLGKSIITRPFQCNDSTLSNYFPNQHNIEYEEKSNLNNFCLEEEDNNENINIAIRLRPFLSFENKIRSIRVLDDKNLELQTQINGDKMFSFNKIYGENSSQKDVFDHSCQSLINNCLNGFNSCLFTYGQTGTGNIFFKITFFFTILDFSLFFILYEN